MRVPSWLRLALRPVLCIAILLSAGFASAQEARPAAKLDLRAGDHIAIIGNTLADRMQHDGWLETYLYTRFPTHDLVIRNLGFSGDELTTRLRSMDFGTPDMWLSGVSPIPQPKRINKGAQVRENRFETTNTKADVVFAFFGYNESYAGDQGLPKFKQDLDGFIKHTLAQKYNGKSAPRLVLFSPIAHEKLKDINMADAGANNARLEKYTAAMAEVAAAHKLPFVDLFHASQALYAKSPEPLTINGVHLTERGNQLVADAIDRALFPDGPAPERKSELVEKLRQAVRDKNHYWFNRYRTVDGFSMYGDRAFIGYAEGQTNYEATQRELEVLDVMTANREKRVWALAQGKDLPVDDSNTPPFIQTETNAPGPLPGGKHVFIDGEAAIAKMTVNPNMKVNLFASEKEFPELVNPVQMSFDPKGRLWVAVWPTYPHWKPKEDMNDKLLILEDTDGDGKADKCTVFADHLHCPTGFEFYRGGVLIAQAPDLMFLKDTDGDDKADVRQRVLHGLDSADTHHTANSFVLDPGGALYFQEGTFHHTQVETPWGPTVRSANAGVFRYEPRSQKFEVYVNYGFANPHGHVFDRWGQDIVVDGTGADPMQAALFSGQTADYQQRHPHPPQVYQQKTRPCPGMEILSSRHFPEANQGNLLVANVIGYQGILQYKLSDKGAGLAGSEVEPILSSSDRNFRPTDLRIAPDGSLYFIDWHNPIIGHLQHALRDPSRDREHGRVYRVTYNGRPLLAPTPIAGQPIEKLLEVLKEPEDRVRYRARIELGGRDTEQVIAAAAKWIETLDRKDPDYEHQMLEALWLHQSHNVVNEGLLKRMLRSPDFHARAAATRVLCYWRDRVGDPLALLQQQINDSSPRVRLEAIRALAFMPNSDAIPVALQLLTQPTDPYLSFTFNETMNTLERRLGSHIDRKNVAASLVGMLTRVAPERRASLVETICRYGSAKELRPVWEQVQRGDYSPALRHQALTQLAEAAITRRAQPEVAAAEVRKLVTDARDGSAQADAIRLAAAWKVKDATEDFARIARDDKATPEARQAAIDALATMGDAATLRTLAAPPQPLPVRFRAAVGLAQLDLEGGADAAAAALAAAGPNDDPSFVVESFLTRKNGSDRLAAALGKEKLGVDNAKHMLRAMYLAGRNDAALGGVVSKVAGIDAAPKAPSADEVKQIAADVLSKGDPARGERVFRRADLGCIKCHALSKAGGRIGPDLGPVGAASPLDYIITSILDPNASIKEEYLTKVVTTTGGQVVTGIVAARDGNQLTLKDATGKHVHIPIAEIDEEAKGKSLMPEGVTRILTQGELLDLIRFVSELGKPGPYALRTTPTVLRWKRLRELPEALRGGVPNRDAVRDHLLRAAPETWEPVYTRVDGTLPLEEARGSSKQEALYLQGDLQVVQGGPIEFRVDATGPIVFWIDEEPYEKQGRVVVPLTAGRHRITVRATPADASATIKVELGRPDGSRAQFEVVQGE